MSNSITTHINEHHVANSARMLKRTKERQYGNPVTIVIVEGSSDSNVYSFLFDSSSCHVILSFGKDNAIKALAILIKSSFSGVLAVIDDDFDSLNDISYDDSNIIVSDCHDLEAMIIASPAFNKLLSLYLPPDKKHFTDRLIEDTRTKLIELSTPIGLTRWMSNIEGLELDFKQIYIRAFIDTRNLSIDIPMMIDEVLARNGGCTLKKDQIESNLSDLKNKDPDPRYLCQGHDLIKLIILILPRILSEYISGSRDDRRQFILEIEDKLGNPKAVLEKLILSYEKSYFQKTRMYQKLLVWEKKNILFKVFEN